MLVHVKAALHCVGSAPDHLQMLACCEQQCVSGDRMARKCLAIATQPDSPEVDRSFRFLVRALYFIIFPVVALHHALRNEDHSAVFQCIRLLLPLLAYSGCINYVVFLVEALAVYASLDVKPELKQAYHNFMCWVSGSCRSPLSMRISLVLLNISAPNQHPLNITTLI